VAQHVMIASSIVLCGQVMGIAEVREENLGVGSGVPDHLGQASWWMNSEVGLQSQSASAFTATPAYIVHRPTVRLCMAVWQRKV